MKKFLWYSFTFLLVAALGVTALSVYFYRAPSAVAEKTVMLAPGIGARGILRELHAQGVTPAPWVIALPLVASGQYRGLKAGEYAFPAGASPAQVMSQIVAGKVVVHKLTIPEGWNVAQLRAAFLAEPLLTGELPAAIAEGSVYPDTLLFSRGEGRAELLAKLQHARAQKLEVAWATRDANLPVATPEQALILASVVEKETGVPEERPQVAGVFINRLRLGMKLQSDPTVVYGIEQKLGHAMGRALTSADLATDTPFNSYTREGLPPTPICNPGQAAIDAVLHPAATDALYFVATGHGGHHFSATLEQHEKNVMQYRHHQAGQSSPK